MPGKEEFYETLRYFTHKLASLPTISLQLATEADERARAAAPVREGEICYGGKFTRGTISWFDGQKGFGFLKSEFVNEDMFARRPSGIETRPSAPASPGASRGRHQHSNAAKNQQGRAANVGENGARAAEIGSAPRRCTATTSGGTRTRWWAATAWS